MHQRAAGFGNGLGQGGKGFVFVKSEAEMKTLDVTGGVFQQFLENDPGSTFSFAARKIGAPTDA